MITSQYYYALVSYGAEEACKKEFKSLYPKSESGFFKKGFVTFKGQFSLDDACPLIFSRRSGLSFGTLKDFTTPMLIDHIESLKKKFKTDIVSVMARETYARDKEGDDTLIKKAQEIQIYFSDNNKKSNKVLDVIFVGPKEVFFGLHSVNDQTDLLPGGKYYLPLPETAPSRAYLKVKEAALRLNYKWPKDKTVLDLGASPGGASLFFLELGHKVYGVDSALMADVCLKNKNFKHLKKTTGQISESDLTGSVDCVAMDMNVRPDIAMLELKNIMPLLKNIKGAFLTLKMPKTDLYLKTKDYLKRLKKLGLNPIYVKQLENNRQEIFVYCELC